MTSRKFHGKRRESTRAAAKRRALHEAEATIATGLAAMYVTAAVRLLRSEHGWERQEAIDFGDQMIAAVNDMAHELAAMRSATTGDAAVGSVA